MSRCSPISSATSDHHRRAAEDARSRSATRGTSRPAPSSARASCIRPARPTRADRTAACSCRSPATTPTICRCRARRLRFGVIKAAQARGDFDVLAERGRRALRVHLRAASVRRWRRSMPRSPKRSELEEQPGMQLGMIGLGRMGGNIVRRLMQHGHTASFTTRTRKPSPRSRPKARRGAARSGGFRRSSWRRRAPPG